MPQKKTKIKGKTKVVRKGSVAKKIKKSNKPRKLKQLNRPKPKKVVKKASKKVVTKAKKMVKKTTKKAVKKIVKQSVKSSKKKMATVTKKTGIKTSAISGPMGVKPYQPAAKEAYMNEKQLRHFTKILLNWKEQLMEEVDRTMHHMQDEAANYPDPVDRASLEEEFSLELRTRDRERKLLKKIEEALARIEENDYGYCDDCGAEIGIRRLEARPTANQCIECKTISEIREKQIGDGT